MEGVEKAGVVRWVVCGGWVGEMGRHRGWVRAGLAAGQRVSLSWQLGWWWRKKRENEEEMPSEYEESVGKGINEKKEKKTYKYIYIYIYIYIETLLQV